MNNLLKASGIVTAIAFAAFAPSVVAEELSFKQICQEVGGAGDPEPAGDREGHMVSVDHYSCRMEGGPMDARRRNRRGCHRLDKSTGTLVLGDAVVRKPGGFAAYQDAAGTVALTIADGKVTEPPPPEKSIGSLRRGARCRSPARRSAIHLRRLAPGNGKPTPRRNRRIPPEHRRALSEKQTADAFHCQTQKSVPILIRGIACARWRRLDEEGEPRNDRDRSYGARIGEDFFILNRP